MKTVYKNVNGKEARTMMLEGINEFADVVASTLGARGRNVILESDHEGNAPQVINDGVSIAKEVNFSDPVKNLGVQLVKGASIKTNELAGDGTTTATVLSRAIVSKGWELVDGGKNPMALRKEIEVVKTKIEDYLKEKSKKVDDEAMAINIAKVSVQDDKIGEEVGKLMFSLGKDAAVTIKDSIDPGVFVEKDAGMRLQGSLKGGTFDNLEKWESSFDKPRILILKDSPSDSDFEVKWIPFMKKLVDAHTEQGQDGKENTVIDNINVPELIIVSEELSRRFIMAMNMNKDLIKWAWFRPSTAGKNMPEIYKDLQAIVGGKIVEEEQGIYVEKIEVDDLGKSLTAKGSRFELVVTVEKESLNNERFLDRVSAVEGQIKNAEDTEEQKQIKDRFANLTGGVAAIKVAANTSQETTELKLRIEDAIYATRSAMEEGYLPGGGVALLNASSVLDDDKSDGAKVIKEACQAPFIQILANAGYAEPERQIDEINAKGHGIDVVSEKVVDMVDHGIVDPLKVVRLAFLNAVSVAGLLLTSEFSITNEKDDVEKVKEFFKK